MARILKPLVRYLVFVIGFRAVVDTTDSWVAGRKLEGPSHQFHSDLILRYHSNLYSDPTHHPIQDCPRIDTHATSKRGLEDGIFSIRPQRPLPMNAAPR